MWVLVKMYAPIVPRMSPQHHKVEDMGLQFLAALGLSEVKYRLEFSTSRAISYRNTMYRTRIIYKFTFSDIKL